MGNERLSSNIFLLLLLAVLGCIARPQTAQDDSSKVGKINITEPEASFFVHATSKPLWSQNVDSSLSSTHHPVNGGTAGSRRLSSTKQPPLRESIKSVADQLLVADEAAVGAQMIQSDVRTPPVVQAQTQFKKKLVNPHQEEDDKKKNEKGDIDLVGQGVAVPVAMEEEEDIKRAEEILQPSRGGTPKPTAGISTWVLLSGSGNTTPPAPQPSSPTSTVKASKKTTTTTTTTTPTTTQTTKKPQRTTTTTAELKPHTKAPSNASNNKLVHQFRPLTHGSTSNNKGVSTSGTIPTAMPVTTTSTTPAGPTMTTTRQPSQTAKPNKNKQQNTTSEESNAQARRPVSSSVQAEGGKPKTTTTTTTPNPIKVKKTTTVAPVTTTVVVTTPESEVDESTATAETTTKRTRRPSGNGTKKRKKNKGKRRKRPTTNNNGTEVAGEGETTALSGLETTVLETGNATKTNGNKDKRPLSTRIYNYLAREVMPSVGVGLIGLMVTAGLAGLIMYPFGGGLTPAARRTYEEQHSSASQMPYYRNRFPHQPHQQQTGPFLYYEGAEDPNSGQAEEAVLEQVLDGMGEPSRYDSDVGSDTVVSGYDPQGGFKYPTVTATESSPYRVQYASTGAPVQQTSTTTSTVRPYYRPSTIQRVEATPKYAAAAALSPAHHHVGVEKFYGSEAKPSVNSRTGQDQQAVPSRKVFDLTDRQGSAAVDVAYGGGRVRFREVGVADHQPIQHTSVIAEHGPRNLRKKRELKSDAGKAVAAQDVLENAIATGEKKEVWQMKKNVQELPKVAEAQLLTTSVVETTTSQEATTFESTTVVVTTTNSPGEQQQTTTEGKSSDISVMTTTARLSNDVENVNIVNDVATRNISKISVESLNSSNVAGSDVEINGEAIEDNSNSPSSDGESFSFMGLVRRIAQAKLNLGLNFLKNTSNAFGKYIENVQKRMSETLSDAADVRYKESGEPGGFWDTVRRIQRHIQRGYRSVVNGRRPRQGNEKRE